MTWYAADIIMSVRADISNQSRYPVFCNVVLVSAESDLSAWEKAEKYGLEEAALDDELTLDGIPAKMVFEGVRKLVEVVSLNGVGEEIESGSELTYFRMEANSIEVIEKIAGGDDVEIKIVG